MDGVWANDAGGSWQDEPRQPAGASGGGEWTSGGGGGGSSQDLPPAPGTASIPEGHVRLYHQTREENLEDIRKNGIGISHARGIEGPKAIYAGTEGFYGKPDEVPTVEFHVPKDRWDAPFVKGDYGLADLVPPESIIGIHYPWHQRARYIEKDPSLLKDVMAGEHDDLLNDKDYGQAIAYIKRKYASSLTQPARDPGAGDARSGGSQSRAGVLRELLSSDTAIVSMDAFDPSEPRDNSGEWTVGGKSLDLDAAYAGLQNAAVPPPNDDIRDDIIYYTQGGYEEINECLRDPNKCGGPAPSGSNEKNWRANSKVEVDRYAARLESWIDSNALPYDITVYRQVAGPFVDELQKNLKVGMRVPDKAFMSASLFPSTKAASVMEAEHTNSEIPSSLRFKISAPKGTHAVATNLPSTKPDILAPKREYEVLFQRDSILTITAYDPVRREIEASVSQPRYSSRPIRSRPSFTNHDTATVSMDAGFDPSESRDPKGEWTSGGGSSSKISVSPKYGKQPPDKSNRIYNKRGYYPRIKGEKISRRFPIGKQLTKNLHDLIWSNNRLKDSDRVADALYGLSSYYGDLYRGSQLPKSFINTLKVGDVLTLNHTAETTPQLDEAEGFAGGFAGDDDEPVVYHIKKGLGADLSAIDWGDEETQGVVETVEDVLIPKGERFKILDVKSSTQGGFDIWLEQIHDQPKPASDTSIIVMDAGFDPSESRDADGRWTDSSGAKRGAHESPNDKSVDRFADAARAATPKGVVFSDSGWKKLKRLGFSHQRDHYRSVRLKTPGGGFSDVTMYRDAGGNVSFQQHDTSLPDSEKGKGLGGKLIAAIVAGFNAAGVSRVPIHANANPSFWSHMNKKHGGKVYSEDTATVSMDAFDPSEPRDEEGRWYHGTTTAFHDPKRTTPLYLTQNKRQAWQYARGVHLGGEGGNAAPHVKAFHLKDFSVAPGKISDINGDIFDAMDKGDDIEDGVQRGIEKAKKQGARYVEFDHPNAGEDGEHRVRISLYPHEDLMHVGTSFRQRANDTATVVMDAGFDPSESRDPKGEWTSGGGSSGSSQTHIAGSHVEGYSTKAQWTNDGRIYTSNVNDAAKGLAAHQRVVLVQPREVSTLIDLLGDIAKKAQAAGKEAPHFNLCDVSVPGTNLFCAQSKNIPRPKMPQIDDIKKFSDFLENQGYKTSKENENASYIRATQNEIDGVKVARMMAEMRKDPKQKRVIVSSDNYVLDGHHHWAAAVGLDTEGHKLGKLKIRILRIDAPITALLEAADNYGARRSDKTYSGTSDTATVSMDDFDPAEPRNEKGEWTSGGGSSAGAVSEKPKLNEKLVNVGGDPWNRETAKRLAEEEATIHSDLDKIVAKGLGDKDEVESPGEEDDSPGSPESWEDLPSEQQEAAAKNWKENNFDSFQQSEAESWMESDMPGEIAAEKVAEDFNNGEDTEWAVDALKEFREEWDEDGKSRIPFSNEDLISALDMDDKDGSLSFNEKRLDELEPDVSGWKEPLLPGFTQPPVHELLTAKMREEILNALEQPVTDEIDKVKGNLDPSDYMDKDLVKESMDSYWDDSIQDEEKFDYAKKANIVEEPEESGESESTPAVLKVPEKWDPLNKTSGEDYKRTQAMARYLFQKRAAAIFKQRGLEFDNHKVASLDHSLWEQWKGSSISDGGKLLQLAIAEELGGRLNLERLGDTRDSLIAGSGYRGGAPGDAGYQAIKAMVRAKWETTQYMLDKADIHDMEIYRGLSFPGSVDKAVEDQGYQSLPNIKLDRNGAASFTTDRMVANGWTADSSNKITIRARIPRTAVVSVPAYGINVHSEHEVVIAGTAWKGWDVWMGSAPSFADVECCERDEKGEPSKPSGTSTITESTSSPAPPDQNKVSSPESKAFPIAIAHGFKYTGGSASQGSMFKHPPSGSLLHIEPDGSWILQPMNEHGGKNPDAIGGWLADLAVELKHSGFDAEQEQKAA